MPDLMLPSEPAIASDCVEKADSDLKTDKAEIVQAWVLAVVGEVVSVRTEKGYRLRFKPSLPADLVQQLESLRATLETRTELPDAMGVLVDMRSSDPSVENHQIAALSTEVAKKSRNRLLVKPSVKEKSRGHKS